MKNKEVGPISSIVDGRRKRNRCKCIGDDPDYYSRLFKKKERKRKPTSSSYRRGVWVVCSVGESNSILFLYSIIIEEEAELDLGT